MQLYTRDGKPVEVPDDQAADAIASGQLGAPRGTQVPVNWDGKVGTVPVENLPAAVGGGARVASQQELAQAQRQDYLEKEYGGPLGTAAAGGLGFADTATFGLAPAAAGALGGEGARKYIREVQEAHPTATTVGQVGGVIAPIIADVATAGAATPAVAGSVARIGARGAEAALEAARLAEAARATATIARGAEVASEAARVANPSILTRAGQVLAAPQRALTAVGDVGEHVAQAVLGKEASSLAGQFVQKVGTMGVRGAMEGGAIGGLSNLSDQMLSEKPGVSGEKFLAAVGHGALLGGLLGGGLGAGSVGLKAAIRAAEPALQRGADEAFVRAMGGSKRLTQQAAEELGEGGLRSLRQRLVDDAVLKAGDAAEETAARVAQARVAAERGLTGELGKLDAYARWAESETGREVRQGSSAKDLRDAIDRAFPAGKLESLDQAPPVVRSLRKELDALAGVKEEPLTRAQTKSVRTTPEEQAEILGRKGPEWDQYVATGKMPESVMFKQVEVPAPKAPMPNPGDGRLSFGEAGQAMNAILDLAEGASGSQRQKLMGLYGEFAKVVEADALRAAGERGGDVMNVLAEKAAAGELATPKAVKVAAATKEVARSLAGSEQVLGEAFQRARQYRFADQFAQEVLSAAERKGQKSLQEFVTGALGAGGIASIGSALLGRSSLAGGALGVAGGFAKDWIKSRGASVAATTLDRLTGLEAVERSVAKFNRDLDRRVNRIFEDRVSQVEARIGEVRTQQELKRIADADARSLVRDAEDLRRSISNVKDAIRQAKGQRGPWTSESFAKFASGETSRENVVAIMEKRLQTYEAELKNLAPYTTGEKVAAAEKAVFDKNRDELMKWVSNVAAYERTMKLFSGYVPPGVATSVQKASLRTLNYLLTEMPRSKEDPSQLNPDRLPFVPSDGEIARWNRQYRIGMQPLSYCDRIADGTITPQEIRAMQVCHPEIKADADKRIAAMAAGKGKKGAKPPSLASEQAIKASLKLPQVNPAVTNAFSSKQDFGAPAPHGLSGGFSSGARGSGGNFKLDAGSYQLRGRGKSGL